MPVDLILIHRLAGYLVSQWRKITTLLDPRGMRGNGKVREDDGAKKPFGWRCVAVNEGFKLACGWTPRSDSLTLMLMSSPLLQLLPAIHHPVRQEGSNKIPEGPHFSL